MTDATIDAVSDIREPHFEPFGWHHWPEQPWFSYQFRRQLGETQEGAGAISECFQAASRIVPGDKESWHREWLVVADRNRERGDRAGEAGHVLTARACWLRAAGYYRSAEFWLAGDDPRRLETFTRCEESFQKAGRYFGLPLEVVGVPYDEGVELPAYFLPTPYGDGPRPVLIAFGGLDSFKDELLFMVGRGALARGISCLLVDGPGQGGALRRHKLTTRFDYEVPVGRCIDYLLTRDDVDGDRLAVSGSSLGGYYAARAGCFEHRLAAVVSHGAVWSIDDMWGGADDSHGLMSHITWVFGAHSMAEALLKAKPFNLDGVLGGMRCPYLIVHGGHDVLGVAQARRVYDSARDQGVEVTLKVLEAEETGAEHCQHDNPTIALEHMGDWLTDVFGIDQRALARE